LNKLHCGDCLEILSTFPEKSIDLIYIDPPFYSQRIYKTREGVKAFEDVWKSREAYLDYMKVRIVALRRVLKDTGSFYLHCDPSCSHYIKVMLDDVFGDKHFRNEIVWHFDIGSKPKKDFKRKHNSIFRYSKTPGYSYNTIIIDVLNPKCYDEIDHTGKRFFTRHDSGKRCYLDKGIPADDVWSFIREKKFRNLNSMAKERTGFPTQKPLALMERIIKASSNKGDTVLDAFCGCGSFLQAAQNFDRNWIGIDSSAVAIKYCKERLK